MFGILFALSSCRHFRRSRNLKATSRVATVIADELNVRKGPGTEYAKDGMIRECAQVTILEEVGSWVRIDDTHYIHKDYILINTCGLAEGLPLNPLPGTVKMFDGRFNKYIRKYGSGFMCACFCGGVNDIPGVINQFQIAKSIGAISEECKVLDWNKLAIYVGKAKSATFAGKDDVASERQKEILECPRSSGESVYAIGNGNGAFIYKPFDDTGDKVSYNNCLRKILFNY